MIDSHIQLWRRPGEVGWVSPQSDRPPWQRHAVTVQAAEQATRPANAVFILGFNSQMLGAELSIAAMLEWVHQVPDKFIAMVGLDPLVSDAFDTLRAAEEAGCQGLVVSPAAQGCHPTHSRAMKLYEAAGMRGWPVFVLPGLDRGPQAKMELASPVLWDEVAREMPGLRLVLTQMGWPFVRETLALLERHAQVYADLANVVQHPGRLREVLSQAYEAGVMNKLLFASGYPRCTALEAVQAIYAAGRNAADTEMVMPSVPVDVLREIIERDTLRLLGVKLPFAKDAAKLDTPQIKEHA